MNLNQYIDHTLLKADATQAQIQQLVDEAIAYDFKSVCVQPTWVSFAAEKLTETPVGVCTVIGFPLGANTTATKVFEAEDAVQNGADEIDMVMNIGAAKDGRWDFVEAEIKAVVAVSGNALTKVIIETSYLTDEEKTKASQAAKRAGADFVKTSTGFSSAGAIATDVAIMRQAVGPEMGVKASGGVRSLADAQAMIAAGATRLGSSNGIDIVKGTQTDDQGY